MPPGPLGSSCGQDPPTRAGEGCGSTGRGHPSLCPPQTLRLRHNNLVTFKESPKAYQSPADATWSWPPRSQPTLSRGRRGALPSHEAPAAPGQQSRSPALRPEALQGEGTHPRPAAGPVHPCSCPGAECRQDKPLPRGATTSPRAPAHGQDWERTQLVAAQRWWHRTAGAGHQGHSLCPRLHCQGRLLRAGDASGCQHVAPLPSVCLPLEQALWQGGSSWQGQRSGQVSPRCAGRHYPGKPQITPAPRGMVPVTWGLAPCHRPAAGCCCCREGRLRHDRSAAFPAGHRQVEPRAASSPPARVAPHPQRPQGHGGAHPHRTLCPLVQPGMPNCS